VLQEKVAGLEEVIRELQQQLDTREDKLYSALERAQKHQVDKRTAEYELKLFKDKMSIFEDQKD